MRDWELGAALAAYCLGMGLTLWEACPDRGPRPATTIHAGEPQVTVFTVRL